MLKYSIKRILQSIVTVFIVITVVFLLMRLLPVEGYYGERADKLTDAQKEAILRKHGLLDPWYVQLKNFYSSLFKGDLGNSIIYRRDVPVVDILKPKIPYSFGFGIASLILSLIIGLSMGIHMAREKGGFWDNVWSAFVVFINAVPAAVYLLFIQMYVTSITKLPILFTKGNFVSYTFANCFDVLRRCSKLRHVDEKIHGRRTKQRLYKTGQGKGNAQQRHNG